MGYAIVRIAKRSSRAAVRGMLMHALRESEVANALEGAPKPKPMAGSATSGAALARLSAALKAAPRIRKDAVQAIDVMVTASRQDMLAWDKARQDAFFRDALALVADRLGGIDNVLTAVVHRDESTPHLQCLVMPRDPATGAFQAAKMIGGPKGLRALQDAAYERLGAPYGLQRGERGTRAEHVPIKRFYAQLEAADAPLPDYKPVPPAPTWPQRLTGQAKQVETERAAALDHNKRVRAELARRAKVATAMHPKAIERQAERYRAALRAEETAKKALTVAESDRRQADLRLTLAKEAETRLKGIDEKGQAALLDRFTRQMRPEYVATLAKRLGIELVPRKGLCDQVRRAGLARSLLDAARLIDKAGDGDVLRSAQRWQDRDQDKDAAAPRP